MPISTLNRLTYITLILAFAAIVSCGTTPSVPTSPVSAVEIPGDSLCSADLVFRLGRTLQSEAIAAGADRESRFSHVGIIIRQADSLSVIHIEPCRDGDEMVKCEKLEDFFAYDKTVSGVIVRLENLTAEQRNIIQQAALSTTSSHISFDYDYRLSDTTRMYCSELTEWAYSKADISLSEGRCHRLPLATEPVILPQDILRRTDIIRIWGFTY